MDKLEKEDLASCPCKKTRSFGPLCVAGCCRVWIGFFFLVVVVVFLLGSSRCYIFQYLLSFF